MVAPNSPKVACRFKYQVQAVFRRLLHILGLKVVPCGGLWHLLVASHACW
jgi:hypothetical protein